MELTNLKRKYLLDSADLIKRISASMIANIHNTVRSLADLDIYIRTAIDIYKRAMISTPFYNTDLIPDFDDYTLSFNTIVFGISNSDFGEYTSYIFNLVDSLYRVFSIMCNSDYFKYVKTGVPIVLDDDLDIDPFYDELLPLPLEWIKMKPEERVLTFIYRNRVFSIKEEWEFGLAFDMIAFNQSVCFEDIYRSDYSDWLISDDVLRYSYPPFSKESYEVYLKKILGIKSPKICMDRYSKLLESYKKVSNEEIKKIQKKALNVTIPNCIL